MSEIYDLKEEFYRYKNRGILKASQPFSLYGAKYASSVIGNYDSNNLVVRTNEIDNSVSLIQYYDFKSPYLVIGLNKEILVDAENEELEFNLDNINPFGDTKYFTTKEEAERWVCPSKLHRLLMFKTWSSPSMEQIVSNYLKDFIPNSVVPCSIVRKNSTERIIRNEKTKEFIEYLETFLTHNFSYQDLSVKALNLVVDNTRFKIKNFPAQDFTITDIARFYFSELYKTDNANYVNSITEKYLEELKTSIFNIFRTREPEYAKY